MVNPVAGALRLYVDTDTAIHNDDYRKLGETSVHVAVTVIGMVAGGRGASGGAQPASAGTLLTVDARILKPTQAIGEMSKGRATKIAKSIRARGFDASEPILVGENSGSLLILDGHHRAAAAAAAGRQVVVRSIGSVVAESAGWSIETFARSIRGILKW